MIAAFALAALVAAGPTTTSPTTDSPERTALVTLGTQIPALIDVLSPEYMDTELCPGINEAFGDTLLGDTTLPRAVLTTMIEQTFTEGANASMNTMVSAIEPDWMTIVVDYLVVECPTVAIRPGGAAVSGAAYDSAYDAWLDIPAGEDLCPEQGNGLLTDELISYVYPYEDAAAVRQVLEDVC